MCKYSLKWSHVNVFEILNKCIILNDYLTSYDFKPESNDLFNYSKTTKPVTHKHLNFQSVQVIKIILNKKNFRLDDEIIIFKMLIPRALIDFNWYK